MPVRVRLERPEGVAGDLAVGLQRRQEAAQHGPGRVVRDVPAVLVDDVRLSDRAAGVDPAAHERERQRPVRVDERDAGVDGGESDVGGAREDQVVPVHRPHVPGDLPRPGRRAAAAVQQVPAEDRRIVLVRDAGVHVDVVQQRLDVRLDVREHARVGPERLHAGERAVRHVDSPPTEVDAAAPAGDRVVADDRRDDLDAAVTRRPERVVDPLERGRVEPPALGLEAERAPDRVAHRLAADDPGAHLLRRRQRVVDLEVAGVVRPGGIGGPVAGEPEPLDVRAAEAERLAGETELGARPRHERIARGRTPGRDGRGDDCNGYENSLPHRAILPSPSRG